MSYKLFRRMCNSSKELPGTPGIYRSIDESIEDHEDRINAKHLVWLATLGQLNPESINLKENTPDGINSLSLGAIGELQALATMTFGQEDNGSVDIYRDFTILPFFL